ncbi:MAG TPA: hypothetical protein VM029_08765, partial [Opitutaceae bacterium]|nr:hypothetical protein [Opitutaceae bacterium]
MSVHNGNPGNFSDEPSGGRAHEYDRNRQSPGARRGRNPGGTRAPVEGTVDERAARPSFAVDPWSLLRPAAKRWYWLLFAGTLGAIAGGILGLTIWKTSYTAMAQIVEYKPPVATDAYVPQQLVGPTLIGMIKSPEIMRAIGKRMAKEGKTLSGSVEPTHERASQIVTIRAKAREPRAAIELANMYVEEVVEFTRRHQQKEAREADTYVTAEIESTERNLKAAQKAVPAPPLGLSPVGALDSVVGKNASSSPAATAALARMAAELEAQREKLNQLQVKFLDAHPSVIAQRQLIAELEARISLKMTGERPTPVSTENKEARPSESAAAPDASATPAIATTREEWEMAVLKVRQLDSYHGLLIARQRAI